MGHRITPLRAKVLFAPKEPIHASSHLVETRIPFQKLDYPRFALGCWEVHRDQLFEFVIEEFQELNSLLCLGRSRNSEPIRLMIAFGGHLLAMVAPVWEGTQRLGRSSSRQSGIGPSNAYKGSQEADASP